jgi:hypothetical protein
MEQAHKKMEAHRIIHLECLQLATTKNSSFTNFDMHRNSLMLEQKLTLMQILEKLKTMVLVDADCGDRNIF